MSSRTLLAVSPPGGYDGREDCRNRRTQEGPDGGGHRCAHAGVEAGRRRFATMPGELRRLSTWLQEQGVEEAVMESTAQYWRSVWLELEPHMCLHLAQAFSNR